MKKVLSLVLALMMVLGLSTAFAAGEGSVVDGYWHYDEPVTISVIYNVPSSCVLDDMNDLWIFEWARQTMNIDFDVIEGVPSSAVSDKLPLIFASNDLPDAFMRMFEDSDNMIKYGDYEGMLRPINDLITPEITPHLYKIFTEDRPEVWSFPWSTPEGNLYYFPAILNNTEFNITCTHQPLWYNTEWFAAVGYETAPKTLDEFLDCMRKLKEQDPGNIGEGFFPIAWYNSEKYNPDQVFLNALGFYTGGLDEGMTLDAYVKNDDGSYSFTVMQYNDLFFEYLKYMNTLYTEGLVDPNMFTTDQTQFSAQCSGQQVACFCENEAYLYVGDDQFKWDIMEPLTSDFNDEQINLGGSGGLGSEPTLRRSAMMILTADCPDLQAEAAARFMDTAFGYEGPDNEKRYLVWYGPQAGVDDTYGICEGWYLDENNNRVVPEVVSGKYASDESYRFSVTTNVNNEYMDRRTDGSEFDDGQMYDVHTVQGYAHWQQRLHFDPFLNYSKITLAYPDEDTTLQQANLSSQIGLYVSSETAKFITGQRALTEDEWAAFKQELETYGVVEYLETASAAFNSLYNNGIVD